MKKLLHWPWIAIKMILIGVVVAITVWPAIPTLATGSFDYLDRYGWKKFPIAAWYTIEWPFWVMSKSVQSLYQLVTRR